METTVDKITENLDKWCSAPGIQFKDAEAEDAYKKRARRIADIIQLKVPDRVPVVPSFGMFPAIDNGFTCEEVMFDLEKANKAWLKTLADFEPDSFLGPLYPYSGPTLEILDYKLLKLPGRGVSANHVYQFVEKEFVTAEEFYDAYLYDPSDFMLRTYLPRVCGALEPLKAFPPIPTFLGYYCWLIANSSFLAMPEIAGALETWMKAGAEAAKFLANFMETGGQIASMGFPNFFGGICSAPYDVVGDWFRGTRGVMLDMYRCPDKLKAVMEKRVPIEVAGGLAPAQMSGTPVVGLMLHKGPKGFMSNEQFEEFYWPTLRAVMMGIIDAGFVPMPLFEGDYTPRLEIIKDIPRGKALYWFETVDIYKAKEILGDTVCFRGNVPVTTLCTGTPEDVKAYVKELIDVVGKGGGLMVDCGIWFDEAKHENVKAMVEFTKEYGVYK